MVIKRIMNINVIVVLIIALAHTFIHNSVFTSEGSTGSISGFSVSNIDPSSSGTFSLSLLIIGFEWATLVFLVIFSAMKEKKVEEKKISEIKIDKDKLKKIAKDGTEIDLLYELLKTNHTLKLSDVERLFQVEKDEVISWGRTLSDANLAYIRYPRIGEAELVEK